MDYADFISKKFEKSEPKRLAIEYNRMQSLRTDNGGLMLSNMTQRALMLIVKNKDKQFQREFKKYLGSTYYE